MSQKYGEIGMDEYDSTPSFYNTTDTFEKYLGQTSHYLGLQNSVLKLAENIRPDSIGELGCGTGKSAFTLATAFPETHIVGIDNREKMISISRDAFSEYDAPNLRFETADMREFVTEADLPDLLVFLHSFHHIPDPLDRKTAFLEDCYRNLNDGSYVCIAETFLKTDARNERADREVRTMWANRGLESYASTFWSALDGATDGAISQAREIGRFAREHELEAGENVRTRDEEYLVTMEWITDTARKIGFDVVIAEPRNALGDGVVLLER